MFLTSDLTTQVGTFALVPQVVSAVGVPVVATGGISDARGVAAAIGRARQARMLSVFLREAVIFFVLNTLVDAVAKVVLCVGWFRCNVIDPDTPL